MRKTALKYFVCPRCKTKLNLKVRIEKNRQVIEGILSCHKKHNYPIIDGVPNFLPKKLIKDQNLHQTKTAGSFGYEWQQFDQMLPEYRRNFLQYVSPVRKEFFKNKLILDAGCGMGRHTYWPAKFGAKHVFGVDLSDAVQVAYRHTQNLSNVTIIKADIYHLPFKNIFDYSYSIGVLHHLPDPQAGFLSVVNTVRPKGLVSIWVYGKKNNFSNVYVYETIRSITRHLPHLFVHSSSVIIGFGVHLLNIGEKTLAAMVSRNNIDSWPFGYYSRFPLIVKINDTFDVLATPKSNYYTKDEIKLWLEKAKLTQQKVLYLRKKSIKAFGYVPR